MNVDDRDPDNLRCPQCDSVLVKVATDGERIWLDMRGVRSLELRPE